MKRYAIIRHPLQLWQVTPAGGHVLGLDRKDLSGVALAVLKDATGSPSIAARLAGPFAEHLLAVQATQEGECWFIEVDKVNEWALSRVAGQQVAMAGCTAQEHGARPAGRWA